MAVGVEFAPLSIPFERRLQTAAVAYWVLSMFFLPLFFTPILIYMTLYSTFWWIGLLYAVWLYYDFDSSKTGGYRYPVLRSLPFWRYFRDYFPATLKKTAEISPDNNYIFCIFCNISTNASGFDRLFPGINRRLLTLTTNFYLPISREILMLIGACDVSKESIRNILSQPGKGHACVIVVGGAEEALDAHPGVYDLTLKKRKGFIKQALVNGAHLVPVFSFGENELYKQVSNERGSSVRTWQTKIKNLFGISPPIFVGRGIFNYNLGLLPFRHPVQTVVGKPIEVEKVLEPSREQVNELHTRYMNELEQLFEAHKAQNGVAKHVKLQMY